MLLSGLQLPVMKGFLVGFSNLFNLNRMEGSVVPRLSCFGYPQWQKCLPEAESGPALPVHAHGRLVFFQHRASGDAAPLLGRIPK